MNEAPPDPIPQPTMYAQPWAVRLGFALVVAFTVILGLAFHDQAHRRDLETISETTAVGDTQYLQATEIALLHLTPFEVRDSHVTPSGRDSSRNLTIYTLSKAATVAERKHAGAQQPVLLLKTGVNQYVVAPISAPAK